MQIREKNGTEPGKSLVAGAGAGAGPLGREDRTGRVSRAWMGALAGPGRAGGAGDVRFLHKNVLGIGWDASSELFAEVIGKNRHFSTGFFLEVP